MNLLIIGATGPTGREIVKQALAQNYNVTAMVRKTAKSNFAPKVGIAMGDVLDLDSLKKALARQDAVINSLGSAATGPFKKMTMLSEGTGNLITAMRDTGVLRLVCITGVGAGDSKGHGPWFYNWLIQPLILRGVYEDKTRQEAIVRDSRLDWTLVRPTLLTNGAARGEKAVRVFTNVAGMHVGSISRTDVAAFCLRELVECRYRHQAPAITY
jgi:putative NADH-flavin reductase